MEVAKSFEMFCYNLNMSNEVVEKIRNRYRRITQNINKNFWNKNSFTEHSLYVGSYGRDTEIFTSDIDIIVQLPAEYYHRFNRYLNNGQSALLQMVKNSLQQTYFNSYIKGDGQVVCINFDDGINFEIVPVFELEDGSFYYPDSNNGGSWKITNPREEIGAIAKVNNDTNKNLKKLCRMLRAWKQEHNINISGILIDTLAYNFIKQWAYRNKSYFYYDFLTRDVFYYLKNLNPNQKYWYAPGSNKKVYNEFNFINQAKKAYNKSIEAIDYYNNDYKYTANCCWREIYGKKFPK